MAEIPRSIKATLYIDGKPAEGTLKNLEAVTNRLNRELKGLEVGTEAWNKKMRELQEHRNVLRGINAEINETAGLFGFLKTEIGKFGALAAGYLGFEFISEQFRDIIMSNAQLSDSFADVRKTTGMSEEAVRRLSAEFKKLDTRTSTTELLGLAEVAGKLGVQGERDVLAFVRAADKISVALGKDLGDTEAAVNSLGKITELFKVKDEYGLEDALIRTGSAINSLGAAGTASEAYLVDFTQRLGPIAPAAKISLENVLGLAATMDELGQASESSTTAIGQFLIGIGKDVPGFARIAGMSVKSFSDLLQKDGNQALIEVLKNLKSVNGGVGGLAEKMGLMGEEGQRSIQTLSALANNLDLLVSRQKLANEEFAKGTSLQDEFNVKNATFGAVLDRSAKVLRSFTSNTVLTDFLKNLVFGFSSLVSWGEKNMAVIVTLTKFILIAVTAWASYRVSLLLANTALELYTSRLILARTSTIALAGAKALLAGNFQKAAQAARLLNLTISANPFAAIAAVVITLVTAIVLLSKTTSQAEKIQKSFNELEAEASKKRSDEIEKIKNLKAVIDSETASRNDKLKAVNALRAVMPEALKHLSDEEILTNKGTVAINKYIKALEEKTLAEAAQEKIRELLKKKIDLSSGNEDTTSLIDDAKAALLAFQAGGFNSKLFKNFQGVYGAINRTEEIASIDANIKAIQEKYGAGIIKNLLSADDTTTGGSSTGGLTETDNKKSKAQIAKEKEAEAIKKLNQEIQEAELKAFEERLSQDDKEIDQLEQKYTKMRSYAHAQIKDQQALSKALVDIANAEAEEFETLSAKQKKREKEKQDEIRKQSEEAHKDIINAIDDGNEKVYQDGLNAHQREQLALDQHYEDLWKKLYDYLQKKLLTEEEFAKLEKQLQEQHSAASVLLAKKTAEEQAIEKKKAYVDISQTISDAVFQIGANNRQSQNDAIVRDLELRRNAELENKHLTESQKNQINEQYDKKIREQKLKNWRAEQRAAIIQATINGALAATNIWATTPKVDFGVSTMIMLGISAASTLASIATIAAQKPPQFATGGYSDRNPEGFVDSPTLFSNSASGRPFVAGEAGREWIAPNWMLTNPRTANFIGMLEGMRQEKRAFAIGGSTGSPVNVNTTVDNSDLAVLMHEMISAQREANNKKVVLSWREFQDFQDRYVEIQNGSIS